MRFSEAFGLHKQQAELDFVDIDLEKDTRLFVDPFALSIGMDDWSIGCTQHIVSFFQTAIDAIHADNHERARQVLTNLSEPNETRLGMSLDKPHGRGVSGKQALDLYEALVDSEAAKTGVLSELAECDLFIAGIGPDKISDITTNVIRGPLVEYTQRQCELYDVPLREGVAAGKFWNPELQEWVSNYAAMPIWDSQKILLVPKASVRVRMSLDSQEYYNNFMLDYLKAEHIEAKSSLVHALRSGKREVTKKSLKKRYPFSKEALYRFTKDHPKVLELYKKLERQERELSNRALDETFDESAFCDALSEALRQIPPGDVAAAEFHNLMIGALEFIFYPALIYPKKEQSIHIGRKRIDITYTNAAREGFFHRLHTSQQVASTFVMVECKNYTGDVNNPELDQLSGRFSVNRGRLGLLVARTCSKPSLFISRCRDTAEDGRGFVIPLFDDDILMMLNDIKEGRRGAIDGRLDSIFRQLVT